MYSATGSVTPQLNTITPSENDTEIVGVIGFGSVEPTPAAPDGTTPTLAARGTYSTTTGSDTALGIWSGAQSTAAATGTRNGETTGNGAGAVVFNLKTGQQVVTPAVASSTPVAYTPTVIRVSILTPGVAASTAAASTPTVTLATPQTVTPAVASSAPTAYSVTVETTKIASPGVASSTPTAYAPTVLNATPQTATPGVAASSPAAYAPTVTHVQIITPGVAASAPVAYTAVVDTISYTYPEAVVADGANHYYRLNDPSGTVADDSIGVIDGAYVGAPTLSIPGLLFNSTDTAVRFAAGGSQYAEFGVTLAAAGTVEFAFRWSNGVALMRDLTSTGGWIIGFDNSATFAVRIAGTTVNTTLPTAQVRDGSVHHLVVTKDAAQVRIYVDGQLVGSSNGAPAATSSTGAFRLARNGTASQYSDVEADEVAFYPTALSAAQVYVHWQIFNQGPFILLQPARASSIAAAYTPAVSHASPQTAAPGLASSTAAAFTPTLAAVLIATPALAASAPVAYTLTLVQPSPQTALPGRAASTAAAFTPVVAKALAVGVASRSPTAYTPVVTGAAPADAPGGNYEAAPNPPGSEFETAWTGAQQVGAIRPVMVVEVRKGRWRRGYRSVPSGEEVNAVIPGETQSAPWLAYWDPETDWLELPGVLECRIDQSFDQNGQTIATLDVENTRLTVQTGDFAYHAHERGYLSPDRGTTGAGRGQAGGAATEWAELLGRMSQVRIWQGYGEPQRQPSPDDSGSTMPGDGGTNGGWAFVGQIDDVDLRDLPDRVTVTARTGGTLTDSKLFGWNKSKQLKDPVIFTNADDPDYQVDSDWITTNDAADLVRVVLRWAGFREWNVQDVGAPLDGHHVFDRETLLVDVISRVCEQTGYVFFIDRPADGASLGIPTFRQNRARLSKTDYEALPDVQPWQEVTDDDLLTDIQFKQSTEPLAYIIRTRGKTSADGTTLGGDSENRLMYVYRPPWGYLPGQGGPDRLAGEIKHLTVVYPELRTIDDLAVAARLLALEEILAAEQVVVQVPGNYSYTLDTQVGVVDQVSAIDSRMWLVSRGNRFNTQEGAWVSTLQGPLLDTTDVVQLLTELQEFA